MQISIIASLLLLSVAPAQAKETQGDKWERALLTMKANGTLPGPRKGQKCLWSEQLQGCLWYTPGKWVR